MKGSSTRTALSDADRQTIIDRYGARFAEFGVDLRTLNPGKYYELQHSVHASIGDLRGKTLLDIGCGFGNYYQYLQSLGIDVRYVGYDFIAPFVEVDRERFPEATFAVKDVTSEPIEHEADYVVMCQVFNNRYADSDNTEVVKAVLTKAFAAARLGASVDMLSTYVNYRDEKMAYFSPEEMFAFAKTLTSYVRIQHDYAPHHFTLFLYREPFRP
jgi:SAM-dependent methyltransferase